MKTRFTAHGYGRTILLSILAACAIEAFVNADEVSSAFAAGRDEPQESSVRSYRSSWLQMPQQVSRLVGKLYRVTFE